LKQYEKHLEKPMNSNLKNFILLPGPGHERIHGDIEGMTLLNRLGEEVETLPRLWIARIAGRWGTRARFGDEIVQSRSMSKS
ncbi:MAG: hypothetical protein QNL33_19090, partial [Akkermansiaceae bacterium]